MNSWKREQQPQKGLTYRVHYCRMGDSRFYGHLEMLQLIFRVLQRAGLPVQFSSGFNPSPKVSFSQALPVGVESLAETFDMELARPLSSMEETVELLNRQLPQTIRVRHITLAPGKAMMSAVTRYVLTLHEEPADLAERIDAFWQKETFVIERFRKNRRQEIDLRTLVQTLRIGVNGIELELLGHQGKPGTNPREVLEKILGLSTREALQSGILKTEVREMATSA